MADNTSIGDRDSMNMRGVNGTGELAIRDVDQLGLEKRPFHQVPLGRLPTEIQEKIYGYAGLDRTVGKKTLEMKQAFFDLYLQCRRISIEVRALFYHTFRIKSPTNRSVLTNKDNTRFVQILTIKLACRNKTIQDNMIQCQKTLRKRLAHLGHITYTLPALSDDEEALQGWFSRDVEKTLKSFKRLKEFSIRVKVWRYTAWSVRTGTLLYVLASPNDAIIKDGNHFASFVFRREILVGTTKEKRVLKKLENEAEDEEMVL
ncbi:hypothetical protein QBC38DRAFT_493025 [Podospora fimiseda]|uniref:Uncharacterized protein n=1 Tax=Podospora fimiseda TaxID=252190 RepID=A0AAN7BCQ9_9PEZI|nr:hypothetical protein QBC38DRAFT_493025 [Podospora fimiseda]